MVNFDILPVHLATGGNRSETETNRRCNRGNTSMRKSPILRPALHATPPSSTDSRYCRAGNAGVGVNSSMGV